ncbi:hypothetical protein UPYG_G00296400 [Umbra pygmaea]|uniref:BZIP domain-containing protein n=1 Tax=Umbra pygmaea TaxID=75934 RepID=A0ABD0WS91_UMBPY
MYSGGARGGFIHQQTGDYCCCLHCILYGDRLYPGGPEGWGRAGAHPGHPQPDLRGDLSLPLFPVEPGDRDSGLEKWGSGGGGGREGECDREGGVALLGRGAGGHRAPQRRPVFPGSCQYSQPNSFTSSHPWDGSPTTEPGLAVRPGASAREHSGCVGRTRVDGAGIGTHPFSSSARDSPPSLDPGHAQVRGRLRRQARCSHSLKEQPGHRQGCYSLEEQIWGEPKHRQASCGSEKLMKSERYVSCGPEEPRLDRQKTLSTQNQDIQPQTIHSLEQQVWDQPKHRQTSYCPAELVWEHSGGEHCRLGSHRVAEDYHLYRHASVQQVNVSSHMPNGHRGGLGPWPLGDGARCQEGTGRLKAGGDKGEAGEDACNGRHVPAGSGSVHKAFFSTEIPQMQVASQPRQRGLCGSNSGHGASGHRTAGPGHTCHDLVDVAPGSRSSGPVYGANAEMGQISNQGTKQSASQEFILTQGGEPKPDSKRQKVKKKNQGSARENRGKEGTVRDQIRRVVLDLEGVLGGLKQVHVEMKEVVQQIDRLTANINLEEEHISRNSSPHGGTSHPNPRDRRGPKTGTAELVLNLKIPGDQRPPCTELDHPVPSPPEPRGLPGVLKYNQRGNGGLGALYRDHDHTVTIETTSPSPILTASVIKTNRVAITAFKDHKDNRQRQNGHTDLSSAGTEMNHVTSDLGMTPSLRPHPHDPSDTGNTVTSPRRQKPPVHTHPNGQVERLSKGPVQSPYPVHPALPVLPHLAQPPYPTHPNHPTQPALKTPPIPGKGRPSMRGTDGVLML